MLDLLTSMPQLLAGAFPAVFTNASPAVFTDATNQALNMLRDGSTFEWSTVTLFGIVVYIYAVETDAQRWNVIFAGFGFLLMDLFNEIANALVLHFTERSAVWTVTGDTSYLILVGLTIEIVFLFSISGIGFVKMLPKDRTAKILGIPNRIAYVIGFSCFSVFVELLLHATGYFHWPYWWWGWPAVTLIVLVGYMPFYGMAAWLYDMGDNTKKQLTVVGSLGALIAAELILFGLILEWI